MNWFSASCRIGWFDPLESSSFARTQCSQPAVLVMRPPLERWFATSMQLEEKHWLICEGFRAEVGGKCTASHSLKHWEAPNPWISWSESRISHDQEWWNLLTSLNFLLKISRVSLVDLQPPLGATRCMAMCSVHSLVSGELLAVLEDYEGQTAREMKRLLAAKLGISRFRQRISGWWWLEHDFYFPIYWEIFGFSSSQLTFIFFRGVQTINQDLLGWRGTSGWHHPSGNGFSGPTAALGILCTWYGGR